MSEKKKSKFNSYQDVLDEIEKRRGYLSIDTSDVNADYIKSFMSDSQKYFNDAQGIYDAINWGNASATYDERNAAWQALSERANKVGAYYYKNRNKYSNYDDIVSMLDELSSGGTGILDQFKNARNQYTRYQTEEDYKRAVAEAEAYNTTINSKDFAPLVEKGKANEKTLWEQDLQKLLTTSEYDKYTNPFEVAKDQWNNLTQGDWEEYIKTGIIGGLYSTFPQVAKPLEMFMKGLDIKDFADKWIIDGLRIDEQLSDAEKNMYYYYLGKEDYDTAQAYFDKLAEVAKSRKAENYALKYNDTFWELPMSLGAGVDSFVTGFDTAMSKLGNVVYDRESATYDPTTLQYAQGMMSSEKLVFNEETGKYETLWDANEGLWKVANDLAYTIGNQLPTIALNVATGGVAGAIPMGISAAGNAYSEMKKVEGVEDWQAMLYGVSIGTLEGVLSKALGGISGLGADGGLVQKAIQKALPNITSALGKFALTASANMLDEGIEEALQEVLDPIVQGIITGQISDDQDTIYEVLVNAAYSGALGVLSAGALEVAPSGVNTIKNLNTTKNTYSGIASELVNDILSKNPNDAFALKMQDKLGKGKKLSGGNLAALVERGDRTAIESAITQKLTERGERGDVAKLSQALAKEAMGYGLSKAEANLIQSSDFGRSIQSELNPDNLSSNAEMDRWAEKIGTREVNPKQYNKQVEVKTIKEDGKVELESGKIVDAKSVSFANESDDLIFKVATERVSRVDGWTNETANAMVKGYDGKVTATAYRKAYISAFEMGKNGAQASQIVELANQTGIKGSTLLAAYDMGMQATEKALTNSTKGGKIESEVKTDESTGLRLRDSSKRNGSKDSQKQVSGVEESTGRDTSREDTERKVADSEAVKLVNEGRKVKVSELGILNGSKTQTVTVVDKSQETAEMKRARKEAEKRGLKVRFFLGDNLVIEENGELISVRGYIKGEYVFVRADHPLYTSYQLMRHEIGHDMIAKGEVDINKVRAKLEETVGKENIDAVADMYAEAYKDSGKDADAIWEECICDSLGDMNVFSKFADIDQGIITMVLGEIKQATEDTKTAPNKTRGAPEGKASGEIDYAEYNKPITLADVEILRSIGRKSINKFTAEEIKKAQKWAYKFYQELKTKSPFFRAWFGEWRAHDTINAANIVNIPQGVNINTKSRNVINNDTGWRINISNDVIGDSEHYAKRDLLYIQRLLTHIDEAIEKAILLDTSVSDGKKNNKKNSSQFMHYLYVPLEYQGAPFLAKITVEEYDVDGKKRAYNAQRIKISTLSRAQYSQLKTAYRGNYASSVDAISIADLYELVKTFDKEFTPAPEVSKYMLNEDGTPKLLYHQTAEDFSQFDSRHKGAGTNDDETPFGVFMKPNETDIGLKGKKQMALYARIENPLIVANRAEMVSKLKSISSKYGELIEQRNALSSEYKAKIEDAAQKWSQYAKDYRVEHPNANRTDLFHDAEFKKLFDAEDELTEEWIAKADKISLVMKEEITKTLKDNNYDGVIIQRDEGNRGRTVETFIALNPEQVKSATDNIGTFSKYETDTKYSRDLSIEGDSAVETKPLSNRELLANALLDTVQNEVEYKKLDDYKAVIKYLEAEETKLESLKEQIRSLDYSKDKAKFKELREEIRKTEARIDIHDKKLLQLESTQALKNVLERAKKEAYSKALAKGRETLHANVEGRHKTIERNRIKDIAHELDKLLNKGTKKRNVKIGAQPIVSALLDITDRLLATDDELIMSGIVTETNSVEEDALGKYRELYNELHSTDDDVTNHKEERKALRQEMNEVKKDLVDLLERERKRISKAKASDSMQTLINEYHKLESAEEDYLKLAHKQEVEEHLVSLKDNLGDKLVSEMSLDDLKSLHKACTMIYKMVTSSNKLFREGKAEDLHERVSEIFKDVSKLTKRERQALEGIAKIIDGLDGFAWNNLRPVDVFTLIGSPKLKELFWDAINAQDKYGANVKKITKDIVDIRKKHGYKKWDTKQKITIDTADGKFDVTLGELMSIYAYSMRKQADKHMAEGGFQHKDRALIKNNKGVVVATRKEEHPYRIGEIQRSVIAEKLTKEQRAYVEEMVKYITKYGEKGNEVSRTLYGIDLFTEEVYFPLKSSKDFLSSTQTELGKTQTTSSLSNIGMSKPTVPNANNPIILDNFDDVILTHLDEMTKYNAYVIPVENLRKVFDSVDRDNNMALKSLISSRLGVGAERYLQKYITDLNGGVAAETGISANAFTKGKAAQVMMNLSVWVQQYFSVIRAMAVIDAKYFIPFMGESFKKSDMKLYEEMRTYAPITIIKEMGGFDVGSNRGLKEYIGLEETKFNKERFAKIANDVFGVGANLMDKLGWMTIWKVVKKEVASTGKFKEGSDAYFEACRKRMNEVITETQVYDSVNARSGLMRSKSELNKFSTAFMGEPTVIVGMAEVSIVQFKRAVDTKDTETIKKAARKLASTITSVAMATAMTSIVKSFIYAMRDDDEDETYWEKYATALGSAFADDINLLGYIPYARDISSIIDGWTVDRPDMQLIEDLVKSFKNLFTKNDEDETKATLEEHIDFAGSIANLLGIPLKNIIRDSKALYNFVVTLRRGYDSSMEGSFKQGIAAGNWIGKLVTGEDGRASKSEKLYSAFVRGDTERLEYYRNTYEDDKSYESALRKSLRDNDPRVEQAALARLNRDNNTYYNLMMDIIDEGIFDRAMVKEAFEAEYNYQKRLKEEAEK